MHAYIHTRLYVCMHFYVCIYVCIYMHVCTHVCTYACMHVCTHACTYVCMYTCASNGSARRSQRAAPALQSVRAIGNILSLLSDRTVPFLHLTTDAITPSSWCFGRKCVPRRLATPRRYLRARTAAELCVILPRCEITEISGLRCAWAADELPISSCGGAVAVRVNVDAIERYIARSRGGWAVRN